MVDFSEERYDPEEADRFFEEIGKKALLSAMATTTRRRVGPALLSRVSHSNFPTLSTITSHSLHHAIIQEYERTGTLFTDPDFPPVKTSLIKDWTDYNNVLIYTWKNYTWRRASEIFGFYARLFNFIDPNDILQGELGDCYFLSSLSALAEKPERIERLFDTPYYDPTGHYKIKMRNMGEMQEIIIDDFIPCTETGEIAFSRSKTETDTRIGNKEVAELWVILLEKAWAKKFGSYYSIDAGYNSDVLTDLTGAPCKLMSTQEEGIWEEIKGSDEKGYIIAASTGEDTGPDAVGINGLVGSHAYAVIRVAEVSTPAGEERILKIRNPWGQTEWNGDWSDHSDKWTPSLREQLKVETVDDGTFWMPFDKFTECFNEVCICKVHDDYRNHFLQIIQGTGVFSVVQVTVTEDTHTYMSICQMDTRLLQGQYEEYDYSDVRVIVCRLLPSSSLEYITTLGRSGKGHLMERDVYLSLRLTPGQYLAYIKVDFPEDSPTFEYGVSCYSNKPVQLEEVTEREENYLERLFSVENGVKCGEMTQLRPGLLAYNWSLAGDLEKENQFQAGYLADIYHNTSSYNYEIAVFHRRLENCQLLPPYEGDSYRIVVPPGESAVVVKEQGIVGQPLSAEVRAVVRVKR